jgi:small conductance mechanosensitive channel
LSQEEAGRSRLSFREYAEMEHLSLAELREFLTIERITPFVLSLARVLLILLGALIAAKVASRFVIALRSRIVGLMMARRRGDETTFELEKRAATFGGIIRKTLGIAIWVVAVGMALREIGFDIAPILAGAGVVGLAVGFGAQNLVRDVITGLFMLVENQISVNDVVIINGTGGLVEEVNLRTTVLRSVDGTVHIFPNGAITSLSNMTHKYSYYVFDLGVAYKEDTDRVVSVLREIAEEMRQEDAYRSLILEPLDVLGVDKFADSAVVIKARIKTQPTKQWEVGREMNRRIKKRFDQEGIEIPFPHRSLYFGQENMPFKLQLDAGTREEMKKIVREVLAEARTAPDGSTKP